MISFMKSEVLTHVSALEFRRFLQECKGQCVAVVLLSSFRYENLGVGGGIV